MLWSVTARHVSEKNDTKCGTSIEHKCYYEYHLWAWGYKKRPGPGPSATSTASAKKTTGERGAQVVPCFSMYSASSSSYVISMALRGTATGAGTCTGAGTVPTGDCRWRDSPSSRAAWAAFLCKKRAYGERGEGAVPAVGATALVGTGERDRERGFPLSVLITTSMTSAVFTGTFSLPSNTPDET